MNGEQRVEIADANLAGLGAADTRDRAKQGGYKKTRFQGICLVLRRLKSAVRIIWNAYRLSGGNRGIETS